MTTSRGDRAGIHALADCRDPFCVWHGVRPTFVHRDEHGNIIDDYHLCGCKPPAPSTVKEGPR